jgi:hypothetical protein
MPDVGAEIPRQSGVRNAISDAAGNFRNLLHFLAEPRAAVRACKVTGDHDKAEYNSFRIIILLDVASLSSLLTACCFGPLRRVFRIQERIDATAQSPVPPRRVCHQIRSLRLSRKYPDWTSINQTVLPSYLALSIPHSARLHKAGCKRIVHIRSTCTCCFTTNDKCLAEPYAPCRNMRVLVPSCGSSPRYRGREGTRGCNCSLSPTNPVSSTDTNFRTVARSMSTIFAIDSQSG